MGLVGTNDRAGTLTSRAEVASCPICGERLYFDTDVIGRMVERCSNKRCPNRIGHAPSHDPNDIKPPYVHKKRRVSPAQRSVVRG
jgi:hypothetical protein